MLCVLVSLFMWGVERGGRLAWVSSDTIRRCFGCMKTRFRVDQCSTSNRDWKVVCQNCQTNIEKFLKTNSREGNPNLHHGVNYDPGETETFSRKLVERSREHQEEPTWYLFSLVMYNGGVGRKQRGKVGRKPKLRCGYVHLVVPFSQNY